MGDEPSGARRCLGETWELVRKIGEGGMGAVWEGRHRRMGRRVAIKLMRSGLGEGSSVAARLLREAQAAAAVGSDHIVEVLDAGETEDGAPYLVMELLEGETLATELARGPGGLAPARAARLVIQVCRALAVAHEHGVVHRDLKPANLFLTRRSDGAEWIKVLDFGIAKIREALDDPQGRLTVEGELLGTPAYMAPESVGGSAEVDHRADIYSTGAVLFELLAGRPPFEADTYRRLILLISTEDPPRISSLRPDLPEGLDRIVARALARDLAERYQSMADLARDLAPFAEGDPPAFVETGKAPADLEIAPTVIGPPEAARPPPRTVVQPERPAGARPAGSAARLAGQARELIEQHRAAALGVGGAAVVLLFVVAVAIEVAGRSNGATPQPGCPPEKVQDESTDGHCCWPGQTWSAERAACEGEVRCPPGRRRRGDRCDCLAGMIETEGSGAGGHCCFPGQRWAAAEGGGACAGEPLCPAAWRRARSTCLPDLAAPGDWVAISAGTFTMGSDPVEPGHAADELEREVSLTRDFALGSTEVTQAQFEKVMGYDPSFAEQCGDRCPVEGLSWHEAAAYTAALSRAEALEPCYDCDGSGRAVRCAPRRDLADPAACPGYRLPTEAEWEYAARAGTETATYGGDLAPGLLECESPNVVLLKIAWFCANSHESPHTVAGLEPNRFGLFDMLGNVWEWCHDAYDGAPDRRVIRGGSWSGHAARARAASRLGEDVTAWRGHIGCRVARTLPGSGAPD